MVKAKILGSLFVTVEKVNAEVIIVMRKCFLGKKQAVEIRYT